MQSFRLFGLAATMVALTGVAGCSASQPAAPPAPAQALTRASTPRPTPTQLSANDAPQPELFRGVPLPPGAQPAKGVWPDRHIYRIDGATWDPVRDWYFDQMPRYGWAMMKCSGRPVDAEYGAQFGDEGGRHAEIVLRSQPQHTELTIITEPVAAKGGANCGGPG